MMASSPDEAFVFENIAVAGVGLELWTQGSGRPLVYLHPGDGLDFSRPVLRRLADSYQVFAPSHPGFGGSDLPPSIDTVDDLAYLYLDFLKSREISDAILVGVSFGAWIAAEIAIKCTARIAGLVLVGAIGAKFGDRLDREITDLFSVPQYELGNLLYADRRKLDYSEWSEAELLRAARNHESFALFGWSPTLHDPKLRQRLHRIAVPTLLLCGSDDQVVSPEYGRRFAHSIPDAGFEVIEGAGHYPQIEQTDRFIALLETFAAALPEAGAGHASRR